MIKPIENRGKRVTAAEAKKRVELCYQKRFVDEKPITIKEWIEFCKEEYPDKSGMTYTKIWADAGEKYENDWKSRLKKLLTPAVEKLQMALESEDEKIRQRAIDQVMKYTGNDIQRVQAEVKSEIKVSFGDDNPIKQNKE